MDIEIIRKVKKLKNKGILNSEQIQQLLNLSQPTLSRLVKEGIIRRLDYGLYSHPEIDIPEEELDFAVACLKFRENSAIGGLTALFHYNLIEQPPAQIWVISAPKKTNHNKNYRLLRTKTTFKIGINNFKFYRMTSIERSIIEAFKFSTKIGERVAIGAARRSLQEGLTTEKKLGDMATSLKLRFAFEKNWEAIVS